VEAQRPPSGELLYAVRDGPGDPEKQPKLSDETKDLILKLTNAAGPENAALFKMLVESGEAAMAPGGDIASHSPARGGPFRRRFSLGVGAHEVSGRIAKAISL
jgi:hypothetical protein